MLDGRMDIHGTVKDLRSRGVLDDVVKEEVLLSKELKEEAAVEGVGVRSGGDANGAGEKDGDGVATVGNTNPRKLVKEEERAEGRVKWRVYNTYLKAS
jgi:hypothetical protein